MNKKIIIHNLLIWLFIQGIYIIYSCDREVKKQWTFSYMLKAGKYILRQVNITTVEMFGVSKIFEYFKKVTYAYQDFLWSKIQ